MGQYPDVWVNPGPGDGTSEISARLCTTQCSQQSWAIGVEPGFGNLLVFHAVEHQSRERKLSPTGWNAEKLTIVVSVDGVVDSDKIILSHHRQD